MPGSSAASARPWTTYSRNAWSHRGYAVRRVDHDAVAAPWSAGVTREKALSLLGHARLGLEMPLRLVPRRQPPRHLRGDGLGEAVGRFLAAQIAGADPVAQEVERRVLDRLAGADLAELVEQKRQCQEDRRRVGQVLAG